MHEHNFFFAKKNYEYLELICNSYYIPELGGGGGGGSSEESTQMYGRKSC